MHSKVKKVLSVLLAIMSVLYVFIDSSVKVSAMSLIPDAACYLIVYNKDGTSYKIDYEIKWGGSSYEVYSDSDWVNSDTLLGLDLVCPNGENGGQYNYAMLWVFEAEQDLDEIYDVSKKLERWGEYSERMTLIWRHQSWDAAHRNDYNYSFARDFAEWAEPGGIKLAKNGYIDVSKTDKERIVLLGKVGSGREKPDNPGYVDGDTAVEFFTFLTRIKVDKYKPVVEVSPNSSDWEDSKKVTIKAYDTGSGLASGNSYQYAISNSNTQIPSTGWTNYDANGTDMTLSTPGTWYIWTRQIKDNVGKASVSLNNTEYNVSGAYKIKAGYKVEHYIQNANGEYPSTPNETDSLSGAVGSTAMYTAKNYSSFGYDSPAATTSQTINANGNTVVKLYYPRNTYSLSLTTGTGIQSVSGGATGVRWGDTKNINAVVKAGYTWSGWSGTNAPNPNNESSSLTMPKSNVSLTATATANNYTVTFDGNGGTPNVGSRTVTFDSTNFNSSAVSATRTGWELLGWYTNSDGTGEKVFDISGDAVQGTYWSAEGNTAKWRYAGNLTVYAHWKDVTPPVIGVNRESSSVCRNIDMLITASDNVEGSGLSSDNSYQYYLSSSETKLDGGEWKSYTSGTSFKIGESLNGTYYMFIKRVRDNENNVSSQNGSIANIGGTKYHLFGPYIFDNEAPTGVGTYIENESTLGITDNTSNAYGVVEASNVNDNIAGVERIVLNIWDTSNVTNSKSYTLSKIGDKYIVNFNVYNSLVNENNVTQVGMSITLTDKVGNSRNVPITTYDFGDDTNGNTIDKSEVGYDEVGNGDNVSYIRDAFRIYPVIDNGKGGNEFKKGAKGTVTVYTFGYVDTLAINFGSLNNFVNTLNGVKLPSYNWDKDPNLPMTSINHGVIGKYEHKFNIPIYAEESTYTDVATVGIKKGVARNKCIELEVKGSLLSDLKTTIKYN